jgi:hypothetical protein
VDVYEVEEHESVEAARVGVGIYEGAQPVLEYLVDSRVWTGRLEVDNGQVGQHRVSAMNGHTAHRYTHRR